MSSDDDKTDTPFQKWLFVVITVYVAGLVLFLLTGCDNGESRRQQADRIEKQIGKIELQRERGR